MDNINLLNEDEFFKKCFEIGECLLFNDLAKDGHPEEWKIERKEIADNYCYYDLFNETKYKNDGCGYKAKYFLRVECEVGGTYVSLYDNFYNGFIDCMKI